ncbi:unnamed protein product, partial [marine sediment metagenome]
SQLQPKNDVSPREGVNDFIIIGGETIISTKVIIKRGMKIDAHSAITKDAEI